MCFYFCSSSGGWYARLSLPDSVFFSPTERACALLNLLGGETHREESDTTPRLTMSCSWRVLFLLLLGVADNYNNLFYPSVMLCTVACHLPRSVVRSFVIVVFFFFFIFRPSPEGRRFSVSGSHHRFIYVCMRLLFSRECDSTLVLARGAPSPVHDSKS